MDFSELKEEYLFFIFCIHQFLHHFSEFWIGKTSSCLFTLLHRAICIFDSNIQTATIFFKKCMQSFTLLEECFFFAIFAMDIYILYKYILCVIQLAGIYKVKQEEQFRTSVSFIELYLTVYTLPWFIDWNCIFFFSIVHSEQSLWHYSLCPYQ